MPDTGAPWNIPYVAGTDLVADWPTDSLALANAVASGLDAASEVVAVVQALKTDTWSASVTTGADSDVTGLSITHEVDDAANRLIIFASIGVNGSSGNDTPPSFLLKVDGTAFGVGDADGTRPQVTTGARAAYDNLGASGVPQSMVWSYTPGSGSKTYTVAALNPYNTTRTLYVNRAGDDSNNVFGVRGVSSLIIMEVKA